MKNYSLLHNTNTNRHQHNLLMGNLESHVMGLILELGHYVERLEHRVYVWMRKIEEFFTIVYHDKKLFILFCCVMLVAIVIAQLLMLVAKPS